jgi:hypothetical protein
LIHCDGQHCGRAGFRFMGTARPFASSRGQHIGVRVCRMMYRRPSESHLLPLQVADLRGPQTVAITNLIFVLPPNVYASPPVGGDFSVSTDDCVARVTS